MTLENAYFDYCAGRFAEALGQTNDAQRLLQRSLNYRNIYDPSVGNMHAKNADGSWTKWEGATREGQGCVESNPYQQGWFVPQDVPGLIDLMGKDYFLSYLTGFFEKTPLSFKWNEYATTPMSRSIIRPICSPMRASPGFRKNGPGSSWTTPTGPG